MKVYFQCAFDPSNPSYLRNHFVSTSHYK